MNEQESNQSISKSADTLAYPEKASRFRITRVARTGIEEFDPLSDESQDLMELTVTELRKSQTEEIFSGRQRSGSIQKGRFCVTRERRATADDNFNGDTHSTKPVIDPDDDLLTF